MAQAQTFFELGSMDIKKGVTYNPADIQAFAAAANIVKLSKGNAQFQIERDRNGKVIEEEDGSNNWLPTGIRGIKVTITDTTITYPDTFPNVPTVWEYGYERIMTANIRITPHEDGGVITYGTMVTP